MATLTEALTEVLTAKLEQAGANLKEQVHEEMRRCLREAVTSMSMVTEATSAQCGGGGGDEADCGDGRSGAHDRGTNIHDRGAAREARGDADGERASSGDALGPPFTGRSRGSRSHLGSPASRNEKKARAEAEDEFVVQAMDDSVSLHSRDGLLHGPNWANRATERDQEREREHSGAPTPLVELPLQQIKASKTAEHLRGVNGEHPVTATESTDDEMLFSPSSSHIKTVVRQSLKKMLTNTGEFDEEDDGDAALEKSSLKRTVYRIMVIVVRSAWFDQLVCCFICINALTIGIQTNYSAVHPKDPLPHGFRVIEIIFCVLFTFELAIRIAVWRFRFLVMSGWQWNVFDAIIVGLQLLEEVLSQFQHKTIVQNLSVTRVLRILRLIRVIRLVRILRLIRELRTLVSSISNSMKSLGWTVLLLTLMIYTVSLYLTQLVTDHRKGYEPGMPVSACSSPDSNLDELDRYYGTLLSTMLSLFQAITGGLDWDNLLLPLLEEMSPGIALLFTMYIAFTVFAMMNVVTGIFVESVVISAKADKDFMLLNNVREIFNTMEGGLDTGTMSWDDFQGKLDSPQMQQFFKGLDLDPCEARSLFKLLDVDDSGLVDADEFLSGCFRLRGPAKALDMALLYREVRNLSTRVKSEIFRHSPADKMYHGRLSGRFVGMKATEGVDSFQPSWFLKRRRGSKGDAPGVEEDDLKGREISTEYLSPRPEANGWVQSVLPGAPTDQSEGRTVVDPNNPGDANAEESPA